VLVVTSLLIFVAVMYLGTPLLVMATQRQAANPQLTPYGPVLDDPRFSYLVNSAQQIQRLGFELVGYFGLVGQTTNVNTFLAYLVHRQNGDAAIVAGVYSQQGLQTRLIEFATRFSDQSAVTTGNSKVLGVYVRPPQKPVYHFPWIQDPARLYQLHQQLIVRDKPGLVKDYVKPGAEAERLCDGMRREMAEQIAPGILRLDATGDCYRPTLKGAYLMCWKMLPPFKQIRTALANSSRRKIEHSLSPVLSPAPIHPA
jgi:hypothetical protein